MLSIFIFSFLVGLTSSSFPAKITGCTASTNQADYHCSESIDGNYVDGWVDAANGWAFSGQLPSNVEYDMERSYMLTQIRILTGMERPNHMITNFLVEVLARHWSCEFPSILMLPVKSSKRLEHRKTPI